MNRRTKMKLNEMLEPKAPRVDKPKASKPVESKKREVQYGK
jgi:hypothetical protein